MSTLEYAPDVFSLSDFATASSTEVGDDNFSLVEIFAIEQGEGVYIGRGNSENPLQAQASVDGNLKDSGGSDITGRYKLAVLNSQNNLVDGGTLVRGRISELRKTRPNSLDGDITQFVDIEVLEPYKVGLLVRTNSGTTTYSSSNSSLEIDGFLGEAKN